MRCRFVGCRALDSNRHTTILDVLAVVAFPGLAMALSLPTNRMPKASILDGITVLLGCLVVAGSYAAVARMLHNDSWRAAVLVAFTSTTTWSTLICLNVCTIHLLGSLTLLVACSCIALSIRVGHHLTCAILVSSFAALPIGFIFGMTVMITQY